MPAVPHLQDKRAGISKCCRSLPAHYDQNVSKGQKLISYHFILGLNDSTFVFFWLFMMLPLIILANFRIFTKLTIFLVCFLFLRIEQFDYKKNPQFSNDQKVPW